jgi:hypothetical protein
MVSIFSSFEICARLVDVMAMAGTAKVKRTSNMKKQAEVRFID